MITELTPEEAAGAARVIWLRYPSLWNWLTSEPPLDKDSWMQQHREMFVLDLDALVPDEMKPLMDALGIQDNGVNMWLLDHACAEYKRHL